MDSLLCTDLLKNKSQPEQAARGVVEWVEKEREMRERLKKEKEAREKREKVAVRYIHTTFLYLPTYLFCSANAVGKPMQKETAKSGNSRRKKQSLKRSNNDSQKKRKRRK